MKPFDAEKFKREQNEEVARFFRRNGYDVGQPGARGFVVRCKHALDNIAKHGPEPVTMRAAIYPKLF